MMDEARVLFGKDLLRFFRNSFGLDIFCLHAVDDPFESFGVTGIKLRFFDEAVERRRGNAEHTRIDRACAENGDGNAEKL